MSQTARPNYVNDARSGKPEAIAALINRSLNPQGISVSAAREGDVLHLVLLSEHPLAQDKTVALIKRGLTSLGVESVRLVMLSARRVGDAQDLWHDEIELQPPTDRILAQPNSTELQHPSITVPPDPEQPMGPAGGVIAQPGFPNAYAGAGFPPGALPAPGTPSPQGGLSYPGQPNVPEQNLIGRQLAIANRLIRVTPSGAEVINATPTQPYQLRRRPKPTASQFTPPANPIGRQMVTETLQKSLLASNSVDLYGEVGVGKTSLLRSLAYHDPLVSDFEDGLFFRSIRRQPFSDMLQVLFDAFFDYETSPPRMPTEAETRQAFESCQALVILDDSTLSGSETEQLSRQYPSLTWLYASEEPPDISAAQSTVLKGLATTDGLSLLERGLGRPTNSQERIHAEGLCDRVQGHPLKILQMAALANEPDCSLGLLKEELNTSAPEDLIFRHSTTLQEPERRILAVLTVLSKMPVHVRHLSSLTMLSNVSPMLENLVRRGLVLTDGLNYELAGNLVELLRNTWELDQWTQFAIRYFTGWAQRQSMESLLQDAPLLSYVVELGIETGRWAEVRPLAYQLDQTLMLGKRWGAWQHLLQLCLQDSQRNGDQITAGWAFHQLGSCALCQGDLNSAQHYLNQAIQVRKALNDQTGAALSQRNLDLVAVAPTGDVDELEEESEAVAPVRTSPAVSPTWLPLLQGLGIGAGLLAAAAFVGLTFNLIRDRLASPSQPSGQISPAPQVSPSIELSTTAINFTEQGVNASSEAQTVTLQNLGTQPLPIAGVRLLGEQAGDFTVTDDCSDAPIPASGDCTATVLFTPLAEGDRRAQLVFADAQGNSYATIPIAGRGSAAEAAEPSSPVILGLRPSQLAFNDQVVGTFSAPQTITLRNQGQFPLTIQNVRFTGQNQRDFRGDTDCVNTTLQPDASCSFTVYFRPGAEQQSRASLLVAGLSNDSGAEQRTWEVPIQGNGVAEGTTPSPTPSPSPTEPPSGSAGAAFSPSRVSFGIQPVGSRSPIQVVTVSNTGTAPLQITGFSVTGGQQDDFSVSASSCGGDIPPDRQCTLSVQFSPQAAGDRTSNLSIRHTASDSPQLITLRGAGETPNAQRPRITRFDAIPQRVSAGQPVELCYGILNASRASIEGIGDVQITPSNCLTVRTNRSRSYILTAVGRDNQQVQRDVFVTVVGTGGSSQTPEFLQPGTPNEALATDLYTCQNVELAWNPVSNTTGAVDYLVKIERQDFVQPAPWLGWLPENIFEQWTVVFEESVRVRPQVFVDSVLTNVGLYRWTVQTRSVNGAISEAAPWHYFRCSGQR